MRSPPDAGTMLELANYAENTANMQLLYTEESGRLANDTFFDVASTSALSLSILREAGFVH